PTADPCLCQQERPDRTVRKLVQREIDDRRDRRMERLREQVHHLLVVDFEDQVQDLGPLDLPRRRVQVAHYRRAVEQCRPIPRSKERHYASPPAATVASRGVAFVANFGITSRANSRLESSTSCCGTVSAALSKKLIRSTPTDSQFLICSLIRFGSPMQIPSGTRLPSPGPATSWRNC